jgi:hypothetical protein
VAGGRHTLTREWSRPVEEPVQQTSQTPAIAPLNGLLYIAYKDNRNGRSWIASSADGKSGTRPRPWTGIPPGSSRPRWLTAAACSWPTPTKARIAGGSGSPGRPRSARQVLPVEPSLGRQRGSAKPYLLAGRRHLDEPEPPRSLRGRTPRRLLLSAQSDGPRLVHSSLVRTGRGGYSPRLPGQAAQGFFDEEAGRGAFARGCRASSFAGAPSALPPGHTLKGNRQKPSTDLALDRLRLAGDLSLSAHVTLKAQGVDTRSVVGHLAGALEEVLGSMGDVQYKCDPGQCSLDHWHRGGPLRGLALSFIGRG